MVDTMETKILLEQEHRFDAKVTQITREMRHTLEQFCREHAAVEGMNQRPVERALPRQQVQLNNQLPNRFPIGRDRGRGNR